MDERETDLAHAEEGGGEDGGADDAEDSLAPREDEELHEDPDGSLPSRGWDTEIVDGRQGSDEAT